MIAKAATAAPSANFIETFLLKVRAVRPGSRPIHRAISTKLGSLASAEMTQKKSRSARQDAAAWKFSEWIA
jgi:hypothetical protein